MVKINNLNYVYTMNKSIWLVTTEQRSWEHCGAPLWFKEILLWPFVYSLITSSQVFLCFLYPSPSLHPRKGVSWVYIWKYRLSSWYLDSVNRQQFYMLRVRNQDLAGYLDYRIQFSMRLFFFFLNSFHEAIIEAKNSKKMVAIIIINEL